jgi:hypothetical protein
MFTQFTKKLNKSGYDKPDKTYTEKLSKDDISDKLEDYKMVDDIGAVSIGSHLRYFIEKDGKKLFRLGGQLFKNEGLPDYVILSNGMNSWSVQTEGTTFFRKMTTKEIKEDLIQQIIEKDKKILEKDKRIKELLVLIKKYKTKYNIE